ncbi:MAG: sporulation protein YabP [Provencibacterium sp.]|jgi:sporulation protein YabP|nr:sporulation protein YabP [Provencibacterium sp.]
MADDKEKTGFQQPHNVILEDRRILTISGVQDIDSYDEQSVVAFTELGELTIKGENLHINKIDVQTGELNIEGEIWELCYSDLQQKKQGIFSRLFR